MKNKIKISIVTVFIIILILALAIGIIMSNVSKKVDNDKDVDTPLIPMEEVSEIKSISIYLNINTCINNYLEECKNKNYNSVYGLLINDYINNNKVKIPNINYDYEFIAQNIYSYESQLGITTYFVYGNIVNKEDKTQSEYNVVLNIDYSNQTFQLAPMEETYVKYVDYGNSNKIKVDKDIKTQINNIEKQEYNSISTINNTEDKYIAQYYLKNYYYNMLYNPEKAYELLDEEYKNKRFENYTKFTNFINDNKDEIARAFIIKYKVQEFDSYKEYLCIDNYNNYYIFAEQEPMDYSVMLDQYTVNDEIFLADYNKKKGASRAQMNLRLFEQMLNRQDYSAAYNVLNNDFRDKYYKTEEEFEQYIKNNLFKYNEFVFEEIEGEEQNFKIKTQINNVENNGEESKIKRFRVNIDKSSFSISYDF